MATDAQFVEWVAAGRRREAAEWLVETYTDVVHGLCVAMVRDRVAAEDLAQDVFGRAFTGLAGFRGESSVRTWLLSIARHRCIDYLRAKTRRPWDDVGESSGESDRHPDEAPLPSDLLLRRDDVEDALAELPAIERAMMVLRFRNGLDYGELGMAFGLGEGAVRMRVSRALSRMRRALEAKHGEPMAQVLASQAKAERAPRPAARARQANLAEDRVLSREPPAELAEESAGFDDVPTGETPAPAAAKAREPELDALFDAEAPDAAPPLLESAAAPRAAGGGGLLGRLAAAFRREPPPPPSPPVGHPLTAFFAATREPPSPVLRGRLLERAQQV